jgi:DNA-binding HxlR family transcriptional regulator
VTTKTYGQYCGVARAVELAGERWALLIIRDLLVGPKRYTDLRAGLPKIPSNVLATRLKEFEQSGLVVRRIEPRPRGAIVYELTPYGSDLQEIVLGLGRWGARSLGELQPEDVVTPEILVMALRATFQPGQPAASYELKFGEVVVHALVDGDSLEVSEGPLPGADLSIEAVAPLAPLMKGEITAKQAIEADMVSINGSMAALTRFAKTFRIEPAPV